MTKHNLHTGQDEDLDDDVKAMASATIVDFKPGDVIEKLLAFANQTCMSSQAVWDYLDHASVVYDLNPIQLWLWIRIA